MSTWMKGMVVAVIAASACCGASAQVNYTGMCDASAAVGLRNSHFVVADDESNVLRIYKRGTSTPVDAVDLTDHLRNRKANGDPAEADIEGAAKIANRVYWISSHARKGKDGSIDVIGTDSSPSKSSAMRKRHSSSPWEGQWSPCSKPCR